MGTLEKQSIPEYLCGESQWETDANLQLFKAARCVGACRCQIFISKYFFSSSSPGISDGNYDELKAALEDGGNPNFISRHGEMLGTLHAAARCADIDGALCVKELVSNGGRVTAALISNRNAPIHEAADAGATESCKALIRGERSCVELQNGYGSTALHAAARSGSADVVELLLQQGADPNKKNHRGSNPLHIACFLAVAENAGAVM